MMWDRANWRKSEAPSAILILAALLAACCIDQSFAAGPAEACPTFRVREQDQIWMVSTRHLGCPSGGKSDPALQVWRYQNGWWQPASEAEFYATDSADIVTPIYVHGNQID